MSRKAALNMTQYFSKTRLLVWCALALALTVGCRDSPYTRSENQVPVADAGEDQMFDLADEVTVTLDGRGSSDSDGEIVMYQWLSADNVGGDAGVERGVDPDDEATTTITLGPGVWTFSLYVKDNEGAVSDADKVVITVGDQTAARLAECTGTIEDFVPSDACGTCLCELEEPCRQNVLDCGPGCWGFMACVAQRCTDPAEVETCAQEQCFTDVSVADALASQGAGECLAKCPEACAADVNLLPVANAGEDQQVEAADEVSVTLDGSASMDPDGEIVLYQWVSADGEAGPDPEDVVMPTVSLTPGVWTFSLQVTDDEGGVSNADEVVIQVGDQSAALLEECTTALSTFLPAEACTTCLCELEGECRETMLNCGPGCWEFMGCVAQLCTNPAELETCAQTMCLKETSDALAAQAAGACMAQCPEACQ